MIADSINQAEDTMMSWVFFENKKIDMERYKGQIGQLSLQTNKLEQLLNIVDSIKEEQIATITFSSEMRDSLQDAVNSCGERIRDRKLDVDTVSALKIAIETCRVFVENTWKTEAMLPFLELQNSLKSLKSLLQNDEEVNRVIASIEKFRYSLPQSDKAIKSFKEDTAKAQQLVDNLHLIPKVEEFIGKIRMQTATVADLCDETILKWIRDNHLENQLKIRF